MTYIKMSADFVSVDELSRLTSIPHQLVEEYVDKGLQFASTIVDGLDNSSGDINEKKLRFLFDIDEMGISEDVKEVLMLTYQNPPEDPELYRDSLERLLDRYELAEGMVASIIGRVMQDWV